MVTTPDENQKPEDLFQRLIDATDQGLCLIELGYDQASKLTDLIVRSQNQAFGQHTGSSQVVGKTIRQLLPQYEADWMAIFDQVARTGEPTLVEAYGQEADRWFKTKLSLIGQPGSTFIAVAIEDITVVKKREQSLAESEAKYRTLFDAINEGLTIFEGVRDEAGQLIDVRYQALNSAMQQQTGLDPQTILGRRLSEVLPQADWDRWMPHLVQVLASGEPVSVEEYVALIDRWYVVSFYPRSGDEITSFFRDITDRKHREQQQAFLLHFSDSLRAQPTADTVANRALELLIDYLHLDRSYIVSYYLEENMARLEYQLGNQTVPPLPQRFNLSEYPQAYRGGRL